MVGDINFNMISETMGQTYQRKIMNEHSSVCDLFSATDNIVLKLTSNRNSFMLTSNWGEAGSRPCYEPNRNTPEPSITYVKLKDVFNSNQERLDMQAKEAYKKRNRVHLKIYYNDEVNEFKVSRDVTLKEMAKQAVDEFKIENVEDGCYRLREYQSYYNTEGRTFPDDTKTLEELRFFGSKSLLLEIKKPEEEFEAFDPNKMTLKIAYFNEETGEWEEPAKIRVIKTAKVSQLKEVLEENFGIPVDEQLICKKDYNVFNAQVLSKENKDLRFNYRIQEGHTLWLERKHPDADEDTYEYSYVSRMRSPHPEGTIFPKAFQEITEEKNKVVVKFTDPDGKDAKWSITARKDNTLGELKSMIAEKLQIGVDTFKIMKLSLRSELKVLTYTLAQYNISSNIPLLIVSGQPLKKGEVLIQFELLVPTKFTSDVVPLFKLALPETMLISDVKQRVVDEYQATKARIASEKQVPEETNEEKKDPETEKDKESSEDSHDPLDSSVEEETEFPDVAITNPENLRLRELFSRFPSTVLMDDEKIKNVVRSVYSTPKIAVQILPEGETETKKSKAEIVVFMQQFIPEKYELGEKFEMITTNSEDLEDFRKRITETTGVENLGLISQDRWDTTKLLSLGRTNWYKPKGWKKENGEDEEDSSDSSSDYHYTTRTNPMYRAGNNTVRKLKLRDGDLVIFTDLSVPLKELTTEEKNKLQELENSHKKKYTRRGGEEQLQIKQQDVEIDFSDSE
eukprot:TRINITY_DN559_c0_g1_i1.p1 TRINITY_DN559_c0_g1~~TRINITY_DN559_c0_g1_i1.p1  ORF type:complete len:738 (+),score=226.01 TRINITY_DN559_c0_g1_i1:355-2568(+)